MQKFDLKTSCYCVKQAATEAPIGGLAGAFLKCEAPPGIRTAWSCSLWTSPRRPTSLKWETSTVEDVTGSFWRSAGFPVNGKRASLRTWHSEEVLDEADVILCLRRQILEAPGRLGAAAPAGQCLVIHRHPRQDVHVRCGRKDGWCSDGGGNKKPL